ncbi:MAG: decaprenyl-phosphate phosphoribosyltransferase [Planctomycetaceae bacterium]
MATPVSQTETRQLSTSTPRALLRAMRPHQWMKNLLCFIPVVFTGNLDEPQLILGALTAVLAFCLGASGVYLFNDLRDRTLDQQHPVKKLRPIASGQLPLGIARTALVLLWLGSLGVALACNVTFLALMAFYLFQNVAYTCGLKKIVILDVMLVANGFLLRAAGGAFAINVTASPWLVLCTLTLALLVAFGKRRHEIRLLVDAGAHRHTLVEYSPEFLDQSMSMAAASAMVMYSLFTLSPYVIRTYGSQALVLSVPMVLYAIFRFVFLVREKSYGGDPTRMFVTDRPMLINGILWLAICIYAIYGPSEWLPWWRIGIFEADLPISN